MTALWIEFPGPQPWASPRSNASAFAHLPLQWLFKLSTVNEAVLTILTCSGGCWAQNLGDWFEWKLDFYPWLLPPRPTPPQCLCTPHCCILQLCCRHSYTPAFRQGPAWESLCPHRPGLSIPPKLYRFPFLSVALWLPTLWSVKPGHSWLLLVMLFLSCKVLANSDLAYTPRGCLLRVLGAPFSVFSCSNIALLHVCFWLDALVSQLYISLK